MKVTVYGAGGYSKAIIDILLLLGHEIVGIYDDDSNKWGQYLLGHVIIGGSDLIENSNNTSLIVAIGSNKIRQQLYKKFCKTNHISIIHPSVVLYPTVSIGKGCVIRENVVLQSSCRIGDYSSISSGSVVCHDVNIGTLTYISPNCTIAGEATIEEGVFMGTNSSIIPQKKVGAWSVIAAGSVVTKNTEDNVLLAGIPAIVKKKYNE